mmetsp:Transcript_86539/g.181241  ORF Transcript_86539/g.181241 Transcript_86539/m.181241 type:complete len:710 (+) Transcript_86539:95-2224(+)
MKFPIFLTLGALGVSHATEVTPVEKVITLLEDLKSEVEAEGASEASSYDSFACFCKETTASKSASITAGRDSIDLLSAQIATDTANKAQKETELAKRKANQEQMAIDLKNTQAQFAKEKAEYEATAADLTKAISSLNAAIQALQNAQPASFLALRSDLEKSLSLADALNLIPPAKKTAVSAFLQTSVDPIDPTYKYHSHGILETLENLLTDFTGQKTQLESDWTIATNTFNTMIADLNTKMSLNAQEISTLESNIEILKGSIAKAREDLVEAEAVLKDDQLYLKDLTERCEVRAKDWDQRSQLRSDELKALAGALAILKNNVTDADTEVNVRALLQEKGSQVQGSAKALKSVAPHVAAAVSLLQTVSSSSSSSSSASLRGTAKSVSLTTQVRQDKVVTLLGQEGRRLKSVALSSLALHLGDDPFTKVKGLIQALIERLLKEATAEATKKGFCDTELGKATKERDYRLADTKALDTEAQALEIKEAELKEEMELLSSALETLHSDLDTATTLRGEEKEDNAKTLKQAKEGLEAVTEAVKILKVFYKQAAKAKVLLQASPVDEDTAGAGFSGAYKGKQEKSTGIIGMLEVIASDFERTIRTTEAAEKKAQEEFVEFDRVSKADISGKDTKKTLDGEDLVTTQNTLAQKLEDLESNQKLLDSALLRLEDLKPTCIDLTMPYEERVAKREEEIAALKRALCILDTEGVETSCS